MQSNMLLSKGVLQKSLRKQALSNQILEIMKNSTKGHRVEEHD
jgi:hypothetical protein